MNKFEVAIPVPATPGAAARPIDGPRWVPGAKAHDTEQTDGRGVKWDAVGVQQGGRVILWRSRDGKRDARTEATPAMPGYPSDEAVAAAARARRKVGAGWR